MESIRDFKVGKKYIKTDCYRGGEIGVCTEIRHQQVTLKMEANDNFYVMNNPEHWEEYIEPGVEQNDFKFSDFIVPMSPLLSSRKYSYIGKTSDNRIITVNEPDAKISPNVTEVYIWLSTQKFKKYEKNEIVELTMSEIADKIGINVKDLRIKEEI